MDNVPLIFPGTSSEEVDGLTAVASNDDASDDTVTAHAVADAGFYMKLGKPYNEMTDEERSDFAMTLATKMIGIAKAKVAESKVDEDEMERVTPRLSAAIAALVEDGSLVITCTDDDDAVGEDRRNRFVQIALFGGSLRVESVGDQYLSEAHQLTPTQIEQLAELGWNDPDSGGNYWLEFGPTTQRDEAARVALLTMVNVHELRSPSQITVSGSPEVHQALETPPVQLNPAMKNPFRFFAMTNGNETFGLSRLDTAQMLGQRFNLTTQEWEESQATHGWVIDFMTGRDFEGYEVNADDAQKILDLLIEGQVIDW